MYRQSSTLFCVVLLGTAGLVLGQSTNSNLAISRTNSLVAISWTGRNTLQTADSASGPWRDVLEAPNPFRTGPTNAQQFFRSITRWATRRNLLEANSEMSVAELDGRIYVLGGYPASRVTVRTVQVYD